MKNNPSRSVIDEFNPCMISVLSIESRLCRRDAEVMPIPIPSGSMEYCNGVHGPRTNETHQAVNWIRAFQDNTQSRPFYHSLWRSGYSTCQYPGYGVSLLNAVVYLMKRIGIWHLLIYHSCLVNPLNRNVDELVASIVTHSIYLHSISVRIRDILFYLLHTALRYLPLYYNTAYNGYSLVKYSWQWRLTSTGIWHANLGYLHTYGVLGTLLLHSGAILKIFFKCRLDYWSCVITVHCCSFPYFEVSTLAATTTHHNP